MKVYPADHHDFVGDDGENETGGIVSDLSPDAPKLHSDLFLSAEDVVEEPAIVKENLDKIKRAFINSGRTLRPSIIQSMIDIIKEIEHDWPKFVQGLPSINAGEYVRLGCSHVLSLLDNKSAVYIITNIFQPYESNVKNYIQAYISKYNKKCQNLVNETAKKLDALLIPLHEPLMSILSRNNKVFCYYLIDQPMYSQPMYHYYEWEPDVTFELLISKLHSRLTPRQYCNMLLEEYKHECIKQLKHYADENSSFILNKFTKLGEDHAAFIQKGIDQIRNEYRII